MFPNSMIFYALESSINRGMDDCEVPTNAVALYPERINLLQKAAAGLGSGLIWCGEQLKRLAIPAYSVERSRMSPLTTSNR